MMKKRFSGYYFKHQKDGETVCFIAGRGGETAFIQVVTSENSHIFEFPLSEYYESGGFIIISGNVFGKYGIKVNIAGADADVSADLRYRGLTPPNYDIMGPFKFLPLQCKHKIVSYHHRLAGTVEINGKTTDFTDGIGYIEGDSGRSFPKHYTWLHCNDFDEKCSIFAAVADIPLAATRFEGCIAAVCFRGREFRFTTYLGTKVLHSAENQLTLKQGNCFLDIEVEKSRGQPLLAPQLGHMTRRIYEAAAVPGNFKFYCKNTVLFEKSSKNVSFEYVKDESKVE